MKKITFLYPLLAVAGFILWWKLSENKEIQFGAQAIPVKQDFWVIAYGYGVTVFAVILGVAYRELQQLKEKGINKIENFGLFIKDVFTSVDLWSSLFGSPLVYALLWKSLEGGSIAGLTVIALQNGFCCTVIISNAIKKTQG